MMKLTDCTYFILVVNAAIDTGKYQNISIDEVESHIGAGDLISFLKARLGTDIDLSLLSEASAAELVQKFQDLLGGYGGRERRKWGVENSGLCLLVAWANEAIQQRWWQ